MACAREIKKAIRDKAAIIFVEFEGHGTTLPVLTDLVKKARYHRSFHVLKGMDDGSNKIQYCIMKKHLPRLNMRVCGVNTNYCVKSTVKGLSQKFEHSTIRVIGDACNATTSWGHRDGLEEINFHHNTRLLRAPGIA